jgi:nitroreductase
MARTIGRRRILAAAAALVTGAMGGRVLSRTDLRPQEMANGAAFEPWKTWRSDPGEGPLALVRAAILASNAFDAQPWLFKVSSTEIELYADPKRNLGLFDPYLREMHVSLGCALENLLLAAAANGYEAAPTLLPGTLDLMPSGRAPLLAARIVLRHAARAPSALYEAIPERHTNRHLFDAEREVPADFVGALAALADGETLVKLFLFSNRNERAALAETIDDAGTINMSDPQIRSGIQPWLRTTKEQVQTLRDGEYVEPVPPAGHAPPTHKQLLLSGRLFGIVAVRDRYERAQALRAGRIWQRAHLLATVHGLAARPDNAAVERTDHERRLALAPHCAARLAEFTRDPHWQPTLMFYMGYPASAASAAPRRPVEDVRI